MTLSEIVAAIDGARQHGNLSSAIRLFVLAHFRDEASAEKPRHGGAHDIVAEQPLA